MKIHYSATIHLLLLLFCGIVSAQSTISGTIVSGDAPAEFTNILLVATADSSVVKLEMTDESGSFTFTDIPPTEYSIRTSGLGYGLMDHPVFTLSPGETLNLPTYDVGSSATDLQTIEVVAREPFLEQRAGMLVVNVDQSITGQGGSIMDLLRKVPGVVVAGNRVTITGKSGLTILVDGRPTKYIDIQSLLRDMPADNIKSIEVISQPGAELDAEGGGGVINIVMKKNSLLGTNGQVYLGGGYGERAKYQAGASLTRQVGKVNLTSGLTYNRRSWIEGMDLVRRFQDRTYRQSNRDFGLPSTYAVRGGVDYDLTDRQRIGASANYSWGQSNRTSTNRTLVVRPESDEVLQAFTTNISLERPQSTVNADAFYRIKIDTAGKELSLDVSYNRFSRDGRTTLTTLGDGGFPDRVNWEPSSANIISGQVDYKQPINKQFAFQAGMKASRAGLDNALDARFEKNGRSEIDTDLSNKYLYDEEIAAAYSSLAWKKGDYGANIGLRFERTGMDGYSATVDSTNSRRFSQLFPSLSLSAPAFGPIGVALAYSYRIERPSYYDLNPFIGYLDPLTFTKGNPFLRPELIHTGQFSITYNKQPFLNLSYDYTSDVITEVTEQNASSGVAFQTTVNLDKFVRYGGSLFLPLNLSSKHIDGYAGATLYYNDFSSDYLGGQLNADQWSLTGFLQVSTKLPFDWKAEVSGWYQGKGVDGILRSEPLYGVSAGLERDFLDDRLNLALSGDGIVQKFFSSTIRYQEQDLDLNSFWEAPVFSAKLTYKFGSRFLKIGQDRQSAASEERSRIKE